MSITKKGVIIWLVNDKIILRFLRSRDCHRFRFCGEFSSKLD
jgi:hypothetical protein